MAGLLETFAPCDTVIPENAEFVIDGGHLLHSVVWQCRATYDEICDQYAIYVVNHFQSSSTVIFDGYGGTSSTKSMEQNRRSAKTCSADIMFTSSMHTTTTQGEFLGNKANKSRLIDAITIKLHQAGVTVKQAVADADTLIVTTALDKAKCGSKVVVVGTDTDLLVMLVARASSAMKLFMLKPGTSSKPAKIYDIDTIQQAIGDVKENMLFIHGITGCDTTSAPYRQGKKKGIQVCQIK